MSQNNTQYKDEGYTSPDFMTNLFKKPLYSPLTLTSLDSSHSLPSELVSPKHKENSLHSPLSPLSSLNNLHNDLRFRQNPKVYRSHSLIDDQKIHSRKYKIFFKTFLQGQIPEEQFSQLWDQLQNSLSNPYEFDKLIQTTKSKREQQTERKINISKQHVKNQLIFKQKKYSKTMEKQTSLPFVTFKYKSLEKFKSKVNLHDLRSKCIRPNGNQKMQITKNMNQIRAIIIQNERLIRQK